MYKELAPKMNIVRKCAFITYSPADVVNSELNKINNNHYKNCDVYYYI